MVYILFLLDSAWGWEIANVYNLEEIAQGEGERSGKEWKVEAHHVL